MSLSVLNDEQIRLLLESLTADELESFILSLKGALHDYSNGSQVPGGDADIHQPHRQSVHSSRTGATTLFMPSSSPAGAGVKVITLSPPRSKHDDEGEAEGKPKIKPTGAITLFSETGQPVGILHASTLTAFRTALASACLVVRRNRIHTITAFGSGEQAYWHIRLALMLRGPTIRQVNVINRRFSDSCRFILKRLYAVPNAVKEREGWQDAQFGILTPGYGEFDRLLKDQVRAADVIFCCTPSKEPLFDHTFLTNSDGRRKGRLIIAIGSYTPDMLEIPLEVVNQAVKKHEGHRHFHKHATEGGVIIVDTLDGALQEAGEVIQGGLTPKQLIELGELVMLHRIKMDEESSSDDTGSLISSSGASTAPSSEFDRLDLSSGPSMSSVYNSSATTLADDAADSSRPPSRPGSLFHRRKGSSSTNNSSDTGAKKKKEREDHMCRWLQGGNVIYKTVGLGLMDLTVGMKVIEFARDKGVGAHVPGF